MVATAPALPETLLNVGVNRTPTLFCAYSRFALATSFTACAAAALLAIHTLTGMLITGARLVVCRSPRALVQVPTPVSHDMALLLAKTAISELHPVGSRRFPRLSDPVVRRTASLLHPPLLRASIMTTTFSPALPTLFTRRRSIGVGVGRPQGY